MKNYNLYNHTPVYTIKELLEFCVKTYGGKEAFVYENKKQNVSISFTTFKEDVDTFGSYLFDAGFTNSKIAVFGENSYEWILTYFSVVCGKNIIVPIDKELDADSVVELLLDSESEALVYSNTYADIIEQLKVKVPNITYISMNDISDFIEKGKTLLPDGDYINAKISKDDLASIVYTSGTTGKSKGVMLTHNNFCSCMYGASCNVTLNGTSLLVLPLHHTFGLVASVFAVMYYGYPIYINRSIRKLTNDFKKCQPQHLFAVPLVVETLYKSIWATAKKQGKDKALRLLIKISNGLRKCGIDLRKQFFKSVISALGGKLELIVSGGAPINEKYIKEFDSLGITVLNGYGITECGPIVAVNRNKFNIWGSVGLPLSCNEVKISESGEILVKGENVMAGYYHSDEENQKVFVDGWFKTGDIGFIDEYGALHITGRIKNLIILANGENIAAEELEEKIYGISYVKEVLVYEKDELITAEVYLDEDETDGKNRINLDIQKINRTLPLTKNIGNIIVRDTEFPKTTTKKIKRN